MEVSGSRRPESRGLQAERLQTLNEISRVVSSSLHLHTLYDTIYEQVGRVMDTSQFFIALHREGRDSIDVPYLREDGHLSSDQHMAYGTNVTSLVIEHGAPLLFHTDDAYRHYAVENGLPPNLVVGDKISEGKIFVPLNTGHRTIGAMSTQSNRVRAYTPEDVQTLSVIAAQAAIAIENAQLYLQSQRAVRQMQALLQVAQMISSSLELPAVLDAILGGMREVIPFYVADILLPDDANGHMTVVGTVGPPSTPRASRHIPFGRGITAQVFASGEPAMVRDARTTTDYLIAAGDDIGSGAVIPLKRGNTVVGVLNVERVEVDAFSADDLSLLSIFASQAAIAIENARLFSEQQRRVVELQTIQSIVQKLTPLHVIHEIAALIEEEVRRLIDYHSCRLFLLDPYRKMLVLISPRSPEMEVRVGEGITGWIAAHNQSILVPNALRDGRVNQIAGTPWREESLIGASLVYEGQVRGVITLSKLGVRQFDENALRLLEIIAAQTALAFDRARLHDELRQEAVTDELTKLYNRRYLRSRFREEQARALRNGHPLAAMILDIDKFKRVNDLYGHDAGDVVLRDLAMVIRSVVRAEDIVARHGGEEFCVLMPDTGRDEAGFAAERLRAAVEHRRLPRPAGVNSITVSVGLALLSPDDADMEVFTRADLAMYEVKHVGGNRVCLCDAGNFHFDQEGSHTALVP